MCKIFYEITKYNIENVYDLYLLLYFIIYSQVHPKITRKAVVSLQSLGLFS